VVQTSSGDGRSAARLPLTIEALEEYLNDLREYRALDVVALQDHGPDLSAEETERYQVLHASLVRRRGRVQALVERVLGVRESYSTKDFPPKNDWEIAFEGYGWNSAHDFQAKVIDRLNDVIGRVQDNPQLLIEPAEARNALVASQTQPKHVFIVHGTDDRRFEVARLLQLGGLDAKLLEEQAGGSRTLIEQIEVHGDAAYVVVLMTARDLGGRAAEDPAKYQPRARQNVVFELGYFIGRLTRKRVVALREPDVEKPSDFDGIVYIGLGDADWKVKLARELAEAGLQFDTDAMLGIHRPGTT
jgi:predicted nucleotide-binding protein